MAYRLVLRTGAIEERFRWLAVGFARAVYQYGLDNPSAESEPWERWLTSPSRMRRSLGVVQMFEAALDTPDDRERLFRAIDGLSEFRHAHVRMAVARAREALTLARIVDDVLSGQLSFRGGIERLRRYDGAGFPVRELAQIGEQIIRYPELRRIPPSATVIPDGRAAFAR